MDSPGAPYWMILVISCEPRNSTMGIGASSGLSAIATPSTVESLLVPRRSVLPYSRMVSPLRIPTNSARDRFPTPSTRIPGPSWPLKEMPRRGLSFKKIVASKMRSPRLTSRVMGSPTGYSRMMSYSPNGGRSASKRPCSPNLRMTSPAFRPACSAAPPGSGSPSRMPWPWCLRTVRPGSGATEMISSARLTFGWRRTARIHGPRQARSGRKVRVGSRRWGVRRCPREMSQSFLVIRASTRTFRLALLPLTFFPAIPLRFFGCTSPAPNERDTVESRGRCNKRAGFPS